MPVFEQLELDPERIRARSRFMRSHTETLVSIRNGSVSDVQSLSKQNEGGDRPDLGQFSSDLIGRDVIRRVDFEVFAAIVATAYAQIAVLDLAMGYDPVVDLLEAGNYYTQAGLPFGLFLSTATNGVDAHTIAEATQLEGAETEFGGSPEGPWRSDALSHPVQLTYLCLAYSIWAEIAEIAEFGELASQLHRRLEVHALRPIGPQSTPIGTYLELASALRLPSSNLEGTLERVGSVLRELGNAHDRSVDAAKVDSYHWDRLLSSTVLIDLDQAVVLKATQSLAARRRGGSRLWREVVDSIPGVTAQAVKEWLGAV